MNAATASASDPDVHGPRRARPLTGWARAVITLSVLLGATGCAAPMMAEKPAALSREASGARSEAVLASPSLPPRVVLPDSVPTPAPSSSAAGSTRLVWVPEWGVYLREREDIVYWAGVYYYYDAGHWYVARSIRGPWARVETLGSAIGEIPGTAGVERPTTATGDRHARKGRPSETERPGSVVEIAKKYLGAPYAWGGSSPAGFDCSGFVRYVYAQAGTSLPHNAASQYRYGASVPRDELAPGDLVFFDSLRHNGIYVGDGRFIHAGKSAGGVTLSSLDEPWYSSRWVGGRRLDVSLGDNGDRSMGMSR